ncbi:MAG TPA: hypothetical protein VHI13_19055 [Candidatus Kapabacteria bacterium]|nr:hypothetical protein [Candidatus Kapabacteria bacterium]
MIVQPSTSTDPSDDFGRVRCVRLQIDEINSTARKKLKGDRATDNFRCRLTRILIGLGTIITAGATVAAAFDKDGILRIFDKGLLPFILGLTILILGYYTVPIHIAFIDRRHNLYFILRRTRILQRLPINPEDLPWIQQELDKLENHVLKP